MPGGRPRKSLEAYKDEILQWVQDDIKIDTILRRLNTVYPGADVRKTTLKEHLKEWEAYKYDKIDWSPVTVAYIKDLFYGRVYKDDEILAMLARDGKGKTKKGKNIRPRDLSICLH